MSENRIKLRPLSEKELEQWIAATSDEELSLAYGEMLSGVRKHPEEWLFYTTWSIELGDGTSVGDICLKGPADERGAVEIGYGLLPEYEHKGYMTEAVALMCRWALNQPGVTRVEAETAPEGLASQRVLARNGFLPMGIMGEEGPRFFYKPHFRIAVSACLLGTDCKYNGGNNKNEKLCALQDVTFISVCPEVMGGLPTPRIPAEIVGDVVLDKEGKSVDREFRKGARIALEKVLREKADLVVLQSRSPSCGVKERYDGSFSGKLIKGKGVFAKLCAEAGIPTLDIEDLDQYGEN